MGIQTNIAPSDKAVPDLKSDGHFQPLTRDASFNAKRAGNFGAGPAALPESVLRQAAQDLFNYADLGLGVCELSHRTAAFEEGILAAAEKNLWQLLQPQQAWRCLWMTGGGTAQFSAVPLNLLSAEDDSQVAVYWITGTWSLKAFEEAQRLKGSAAVLSIDIRTKGVNLERSLNLDPAALQAQLDSLLQLSGKFLAYLYYCDNETVDGIEFPFTTFLVENLKVPNGARWVCDASSNFLSRQIALDRLDLVYAGAQKNLGPSGVTLVLVKEDLLASLKERSKSAAIPLCLDYCVQAQNKSLLNTPPVFAIHMVNLVLKALISEFGSLGVLEERNSRRAALLYGAIDGHALFWSDVGGEVRSRMNVVFKGESSVEEAFLKKAEGRGLLQLKGHRSVGGLRASIYNAVEDCHIADLIVCMQEISSFQK